MRTSVSEPDGPIVVTEDDGIRRSRPSTSGSSSRSMRSRSMIVTLAGDCVSGSGERDAVMTI